MNKKIGILATTLTIICGMSLNVFAKTDELIDSSKISKANKDFLFKSTTNTCIR